jgi:hypothetical protein
MLEIAIIVIIAVASYGLTKAWIRLHRSHIQMRNFYRHRFFETARAMVSDDRLDDVTLVHLCEIVNEMDHPGTINVLMRAAHAVEQEIRAGRKPRPRGNLPPGWSALLWDFFLAISYTQLMRGYLLRSILADLIDPRIEGLNTDAIDQRVRALALQAV